MQIKIPHDLININSKVSFRSKKSRNSSSTYLHISPVQMHKKSRILAKLLKKSGIIKKEDMPAKSKFSVSPAI